MKKKTPENERDGKVSDENETGKKKRRDEGMDELVIDIAVGDDRSSLSGKRRLDAQARKAHSALLRQVEKERYAVLSGTLRCGALSGISSALSAFLVHSQAFRIFPSGDWNPTAPFAGNGWNPEWSGSILLFLIVWQVTAGCGWLVRASEFKISIVATPILVLIILAGGARLAGAADFSILSNPPTAQPTVVVAACAVFLGAFLGCIQARLLTAHRI
jgi:hypothetical protein